MDLPILNLLQISLMEKKKEVDRIIKHHRVAHGKTEYQVLWKGYGLDQATWEPEDNLEHASEIICNYRH